MSILTDPNTKKEHQLFMQTISKAYQNETIKNRHVKISFNTHKDDKKINTRVPKIANRKINQIMSNFTEELHFLLKQFKLLDYYYCLQEMRKHNFFIEVADVFNRSLVQKCNQLEQQNASYLEQIDFLKANIKKLEQSLDKNDKNLKNVQNDQIEIKLHKRSSSTGYSLQQNVYYRARSLDIEQFKNYFDSVVLTEKLILKNTAVINQKNFQKNQYELLRRIQSLLTKPQQYQCQSFKLLEQITDFIDIVKKKQQKYQCKNPCCLSQKIQPDQRINKARFLINTGGYRNETNFYRTDKSEEYFKQYYRTNSFDLKNVTSVQKTKLEEMERFELEYRKKLIKRQKSLRSKTHSKSRRSEHMNTNSIV